MPLLLLSLLLPLSSSAQGDFDAASNLVDVDQFHIQTDGGEGDRRFFRYQTRGGQFRKETVTEEGAVVGTFGWVDAAGVLRVTDYLADERGYRVLRKRTLKVGDRKGRRKNANSAANEERVRKALERFQRKRRPRVEEEEEEEVSNNSIDVAIGGAEGNSRLERRVDHGNGVVTVKVQPLFAALPPPPKEEDDLLPAPFFVRRIQPRGEGTRLRYEPGENVVLRGGRRGKKIFGRRRGAGPGGKRTLRRVVKRRRRPDALEEARRTKKVLLDYQTSRSFHREAVGEDGSRLGEFGYIDPLGVRRVVTYTTGPGDGGGQDGDLGKVKENDYVGDNTYFQAV